MRSSLYECRVMHHRFAPKRHRFVYGMFFFGIDLDELDDLSRTLRWFSVGRANLYSFRQDDYFPVNEPEHNGPTPSQATSTPGTNGNLKSRVVSYLAANGVDLTEGRVVLVTLPRVLGYLFNPVSFYFCFDRNGVPVASIAEVTNTFREMKLFLLGPATRGSFEGSSQSVFRLRIPKQFYVSPYSSVEVAFDFTLRSPDERLAIQIDDYAGTERLLTSTLTGRRQSLTDAALLSATLRHPLVTLKIIGLIHWHALRLFAKRVPWFRKADQANAQRRLYRPHASIASTS